MFWWLGGPCAVWFTAQDGVSRFRFRVWGLRVWGFRVWGLGFGVVCSTDGLS